MADQPAPAQRKSRLSIPAWLWDREKRADFTREGFEAAFRAAIDFCAAYEWRSIEALQDEIHVVMSERLRHADIEIEFIAVHAITRRPRIVVSSGRHEAREDLTVKFPPAVGRAN